MTEETKHEKFIRLRDTRLPKLLHAIGLFENLSGANYECSTEEAEKLLKDLQDSVDKVAEAFDLVPYTARRDDDEDDDIAINGVDPELAERAALAASLEAKADQEPDEDPLAKHPELDGVPRPWIQHFDDLKLIDVGARLGHAMEACIDGDADTALIHLKDVMRT